MKRTAMVGVLIALCASGAAGAAGYGMMRGDCQGPAVLQGADQDCQQMGGKHHGKPKGYAMRHANPMPNLMKIVGKQGDLLGLSDEQAEQLAAWRENNSARMHARAERVMALEAELQQAALDARPKAELMGLASRIMTERTQIIATKADCRDNLLRVLTPEQFEKVISLAGR